MYFPIACELKHQRNRISTWFISPWFKYEIEMYILTFKPGVGKFFSVKIENTFGFEYDLISVATVQLL